MIYTAVNGNQILAFKSRRRLKRQFPDAKEIVLRHTNDINFARLMAYESHLAKKRLKNVVKRLWIKIWS